MSGVTTGSGRTSSRTTRTTELSWAQTSTAGADGYDTLRAGFSFVQRKVGRLIIPSNISDSVLKQNLNASNTCIYF